MSTNSLPSSPELIESLKRLFAELPHSMWDDEGIHSKAWDVALLEPAREILSRQGKGLRASAVDRAWALAGGGAGGPPELLPVVIELLHVGSLVIDDIEDDSRMRRGRPALHRQYGVPLALNTGNWLYFVALAVVAKTALPAGVRLALYEDISLALMRCHQGQALDLSVRVVSSRRSDIPGLVATSTALKTGSLMQLASLLGARATGADPDVVSAIGAFGAELGVGVQMLDDWSGIRVEARREKGREDIKLSRLTWPWAWLAESADELTYRDVVRQAREITLDWEADRVVDRLRALVDSVASDRIRTHLATALDMLESRIGAGPQVREVRADVARLERAYGVE